MCECSIWFYNISLSRIKTPVVTASVNVSTHVSLSELETLIHVQTLYEGKTRDKIIYKQIHWQKHIERYTSRSDQQVLLSLYSGHAWQWP